MKTPGQRPAGNPSVAILFIYKVIGSILSHFGMTPVFPSSKLMSCCLGDVSSPETSGA